MRPNQLLLAAGLLALAPPLRADIPGYKVQTLAKTGDTLGDVKTPASGYFEVGALNDAGQIAVDVQDANSGEAIVQYSGGKFASVAAGARTVSGVKWPGGVIFYGAIQMNQAGDIAFATQSPTNNSYRWDHQTGQASLVAVTGTPATSDLTFTAGADQSTPAINDAGEVAFQARVKDSAGTTERAIFLLDRNGKLAPVALPSQSLADGSTIQPNSQGYTNSVTNAGVVSFAARRAGDKSNGIFVWENGTITPVALPGAAAPGGGTFALVGGGFLNNKNGNAIVGGNLDGNGNHWGLYLWSAGHLTAICVSGQTTMPGGGQFVGLADFGYPSSAGASAFTAVLAGGDSGIYRVDADGNLALIAKAGDLGAKIVFPNGSPTYGIAMNAQGQVALPVIFTGDKVESLVLLTPAAP